MSIKQSWQNAFVRIVSKRASGAHHYKLHRKNLYIFPTFTGGAYLLLALVIWLLGTNYQNNLILALAYFQISLFVIIILNTYNNLSGLEVTIGSASKVHVGESIDFALTVSSANRIGTHYVNIGWRGSGQYHLFDFDPASPNKIHVNTQALKRGYYKPEHLLIESTFPMGLLRCWTWLNFDTQTIVYPKPMMCPLPTNLEGDEGDDEGEARSIVAGDDFVGFSPYNPGDSTKHIAWSLFARDQGLHVKKYGVPESLTVFLRWTDFFGGDVETCLSHMCYWAKKLHQQRQSFGLSLPSQDVPVGDDDEHFDRVLSALALYKVGQ